MDITRKRTPIIPWIIGIFLAGALVWIAVALLDDEPDPETAASSISDTQEDTAVQTGNLNREETADITGRLQAFSAFADSASPAQAAAGRGEEVHPYTSKGIDLLAGALSVAAGNNASDDFQARLDTLRAYSSRIQQDRASNQHADIVRKAFLLATDMMARSRNDTAASGDPNIAKVRSAAEAIDQDRPLLSQVDQVQNFFRAADDVLRTMNTGG